MAEDAAGRGVCDLSGAWLGSTSLRMLEYKACFMTVQKDLSDGPGGSFHFGVEIALSSPAQWTEWPNLLAVSLPQKARRAGGQSHSSATSWSPSVPSSTPSTITHVVPVAA